MVARELLPCPERLPDLRAGLPDTSPNILAQRLRQLERAGVVRRRRLPPSADLGVYELTKWGLELEPVIVSPGRWGRPRDRMPGKRCNKTSW